MSKEDTNQELVKAALVAYCIVKYGNGEIRVPREQLDKLVKGCGCIYMSGDPVKDEYVLRLEGVDQGELNNEDKENFQRKYEENDIINRLIGDREQKLV